jgi:putative transcriptional regulator
MSTKSYTPERGQPFKLSAAERARLDAMTDAEIEAAAAADPDNPPLDAARLHRMALGREVRLIRQGTGLSQPQFAVRYQIGLARLRDYEQARSEPDFPVMAYLRLIADYPEIAKSLVEKLLSEGAAA